jgi:uncharacterized phage protein (TIGR01671 family)
MRPIEFRVWTGKRMLYQEKQYLASFIRRVVPEIILDHGGEAFSQHESYLPNGGVIDEYLLQYTGLLDKNGKKIFEGDIVRNDDITTRGDNLSVTGTVMWANNYPGFIIQNLEKSGAFVVHEQWEVIGNIYENSELLTPE